jgi:hypothetical protein
LAPAARSDRFGGFGVIGGSGGHGGRRVHARRLEEAGLLVSRRALAGDHFEVRHRITPAGSQAFRDYLAALRGFLEAEGP